MIGIFGSFSKSDPAPRVGRTIHTAPKPLVHLSFVFFVSISLWAVQFHERSWADDFGFVGDESGHFVTAAMIADYLTHGIGRVPPVHFAEWYHLHYPKVSVGHWPFVFHGLLAAWMVVFGISRSAALMFQGICVALSSCLLFVVLRKVTSTRAAFVSASAYPLVTMVHLLSSAVMTEPLGGLFLWLAMVAFANWLRRGQRRWVVTFALGASAAIMTRPNGWLLALVPPLTAIILRSGRPVFARPILAAAVAIFVTCAPFYFFNLPAMKDGSTGGIEFADGRTFAHIVMFLSLAVRDHLLYASLFVLGPPLSVAAIYGFWRTVGRPLYYGQPIAPFWAVMFSAFIATLLFTTIVPSALDYNRFLFPSLFPALAFATAGIDRALSSRWANWNGPTKLSAVAVAVAIICVFNMLSPSSRPVHSVMRRAANLFLDDRNLNNPVVLISSNGESGEGRFIAEVVAQQERCCSYFVERATEQLAASNFDATIYSLRYRTVSDLRNWLEQNRLGLIIVHNVSDRTGLPHNDLLNRLLATDQSDWHEVARINSAPGDSVRENVVFYKNLRLFGKKPDKVRIDLSRKIGRYLEITP